MTRYQFTIYGPKSLRETLNVVSNAPIGTRVEVKGAKRTDSQNDRMWAMLTDIALQLPWGGRRQTPDKWKRLFLDALREELGEEEDELPSLWGARRVNVGTSSSDLSKDEMSMMIELMFKFGAEHGVVFADDKAEQAA